MSQEPYSRQVLEETPARATKLLQGIGAVPVIRTLLFQAGMTQEDLAEGRKLLLDCLAEPSTGVELDTPEARAQRDASAELDEWDEPNFARHGATLRRHHPKVFSYAFDGLKAQSGSAAVMGVATLLLRLDALEKGTDPARSESVAQDREAVALLEKRGLTKAERERLSQLVQTALGPTKPLASIPQSEEVDQARMTRLAALRDWYSEWASISRVVVKKRGSLIRLGLATRKASEREDEEAVEEEAEAN